MPQSMGANVVKVGDIAELEAAMAGAKAATIPTVIVIDTDPDARHRRGRHLVGRGGARSVRPRAKCNEARKAYEAAPPRPNGW